MRLLSCTIVGFGRLKNQQIDFNDGLNAVQMENGWGKTTFAMFIEAMFFGLKGGGRRTLSMREHYRPWDGSEYGGILSFEVNQRAYRMERLFGEKDGDDKFALYDEKGKPSEDFTENIGREIFQVDRDSYEKSIFFPQNALGTGMTDSLNAKMGDMAAARDDIDGYDAAIRRLEDAKLALTRGSKGEPGRLVLLTQEIKQRNEKLSERPAVADALEKQRGVLEEKRSLLSEMKKEKKELLDIEAGQSEREKELGIYTEKKEILAKLTGEQQILKEYFSAGFPNTEKLDKMEELARSLRVDRSQLEAAISRLPSDEEGERLFSIFENREISDEIMSGWEEKIREIVALRLKCEHADMSEEEKRQLSELESYFEKRNPTEKELEDAMADAALLAQYEGQVEALDEQYRNTRARSTADKNTDESGGAPKGFAYAVVAVAVLLCGSVAFGELLGGALGWTLAVLCAALGAGILGIIFSEERKRRAKKQGRAETLSRELRKAEEALYSKQRERDHQKEKCRSFLAGFLVSPADSYTQMIGEIQRKKEVYQRLLHRREQTMADNSETIEKLSALQVELYVVLSQYAELYHMDLNERHEEGELLERLRDDWRRYNILCENLEEKEQLERTVWKEETKLFSFLDRYPVSDSAEVGELKEAAALEPSDRLLYIRQKLSLYNEYEERLLGLKKDVEEFEAGHDIEAEEQAMAEAAEKKAALDERMTEMSAQLLKAQESESELSDRLEELDEISESLEALTEQEAQYRMKVDRYEKTILYLGRAREHFLTRYMGALQGSLARYLQIMEVELSQGKGGTSPFSLDLDLTIRLNRKGGLKDAEYFSSGYKDLFAFCTRLALVDVLYQKERPFVILDDPFANFDEQKTAKALSLIKKMSSRRQVIYFTCNADRMP